MVEWKLVWAQVRENTEAYVGAGMSTHNRNRFLTWKIMIFLLYDGLTCKLSKAYCAFGFLIEASKSM